MRLSAADADETHRAGGMTAHAAGQPAGIRADSAGPSASRSAERQPIGQRLERVEPDVD